MGFRKWFICATLAAASLMSQAAGATVRIAVLEPYGIDLTASTFNGKVFKAVNCTHTACTVYTTRVESDDATQHAQETVTVLANTAVNTEIIAVSYEDNTCNNCSMDAAYAWIASHATTYNIKVLNVSAGASNGTDTCGANSEEQSEQSLYSSHGVTIVRSSGNQASDAHINTEANPGFILAVGAAQGAGSTLAVSESSNVGDALDFIASGQDPNDPSLDKYVTSWAAPRVAAFAGEVYNANPTFTPADVRAFLVSASSSYARKRYKGLSAAGDPIYETLDTAYEYLTMTKVMNLINGVTQPQTPPSDAATGGTGITCSSGNPPPPVKPAAPNLDAENIGCITGNPAYFITASTTQNLENPSYQISYEVNNSNVWWPVHNRRTITVNPNEQYEVDAQVCNGDVCSNVTAAGGIAPGCSGGGGN